MKTRHKTRAVPTQLGAVLWIAAAVLVASCSESGVEGPIDSGTIDGPDMNIGPKDTKQDVKDKDTALSDQIQGDGEETDVVLPADATGSSNGLCPGGLSGGFNCLCNNNDDCDSGYCVASDLGKVCTKTCTSSCPEDWRCAQIPSGGDLQYVCLPAFPNLCKPCSANSDCQLNGSTTDYCAGMPGGSPGFIDGSFCLAACQVQDDGKKKCKTGYACQNINLDGKAGGLDLCIPQGFKCLCQDSWADQGLSTPCSKTSTAGTCTSKRQCTWVDNKATLTECAAAAPTVEVCGNNFDDDCNGKTDEPGASGCTSWFPDNDQDQYGTGVGMCTCDNPGAGYASAGGDCNDFNSSIHPGPATQLEICDNIDNNCNGQTDESGAKGCKILFKDLDGDGFGDDADSGCYCPGNAGSEWIAQAGDCNDNPLANGAKIKPGVNEKCDGHFEAKIQPDGSTVQQWVGIDDNCNGKTDEPGAEGGKLYYIDQDKDLFGAGDPQLLCYPTIINTATLPGDCDDGNGGINPQSFEICDSIDNDCNGKTDDGSADANCGAVAGGSSKCVSGVCGVGSCAKGFYDVNGDATDGCECAALGATNGLGAVCGVANDLGDLPDGSASIQKGGQILPGEQGDWYKFKATDLPDTQPASCDNYNIHISFVLNPGNIFAFDVYRGSCAVADQVCSAETVHDWSTSYYGPPPFGPGNKGTPTSFGVMTPSPYPEASGECQCVPSNNKNWSACVTDPTPGKNTVVNCGPNGLPGMNVCSDNTTMYFVRVFTKPGAALTCDQYIIKFDNAPNGNVPPPKF